MDRNHVHMCVGMMGIKKYLRSLKDNSSIIIEINITSSLIGCMIPFYVSKKKMVLSPGIGEEGIMPPETIRSIFYYNTGLYIY